MEHDMVESMPRFYKRHESKKDVVGGIKAAKSGMTCGSKNFEVQHTRAWTKRGERDSTNWSRGV